MLARGLGALRRALYALGGDALLGFSADTALNERLDEAGVPRAPRRVDTWIYHRRRAERFDAVSFQGGAGDLGFEAL